MFEDTLYSSQQEKRRGGETAVINATSMKKKRINESSTPPFQLEPSSSSSSSSSLSSSLSSSFSNRSSTPTTIIPLAPPPLLIPSQITHLNDTTLNVISSTKTGKSSSMHGVSWSNSNNKWLQQIRLKNGVRKRSYFDSEIEAGKAYDSLVRENGLTNRPLNFPTEEEIALGRGKKSPNTKNGYYGVSFIKKRSKYLARIRIDGKEVYIGYFSCMIEAAKAYDKVAKDFPNRAINFPEDYRNVETNTKSCNHHRSEEEARVAAKELSLIRKTSHITQQPPPTPQQVAQQVVPSPLMLDTQPHAFTPIVENNSIQKTCHYQQQGNTAQLNHSGTGGNMINPNVNISVDEQLRFAMKEQVFGVSYSKSSKKWLQSLRLSHNEVAMNYFESRIEAAVEHDRLVRLHNLKNKLLNFPTPEEKLEGRGTKGKTSKHHSVYWHAEHKKWRAILIVNGKHIQTSYYDSEVEAARAYDSMAKDYPDKQLNFPEEHPEHFYISASKYPPPVPTPPPPPPQELSMESIMNVNQNDVMIQHYGNIPSSFHSYMNSEPPPELSQQFDGRLSPSSSLSYPTNVSLTGLGSSVYNDQSMSYDPSLPVIMNDDYVQPEYEYLQYPSPSQSSSPLPYPPPQYLLSQQSVDQNLLVSGSGGYNQGNQGRSSEISAMFPSMANHFPILDFDVGGGCGCDQTFDPNQPNYFN